jgi:methylmalonyl-CoA mutase C-terminal domain/subunit
MNGTAPAGTGTPVHDPEPAPVAGTPIRVILGKMRFDAHDVGARFIMRKLVEAGMEVIFIRFALVGELVDAALQEDAQVIGLSALTGGHLSVVADLVAAVGEAGLDDRLLVVGGVIADDDVTTLKGLGVHGVFGPGSAPSEIIDFIRSHARMPA